MVVVVCSEETSTDVDRDVLYSALDSVRHEVATGKNQTFWLCVIPRVGPI